MQLRTFYGLNNVTDPMRQPLGSMGLADNVHITDTGAMDRREGYSLRLACDPAGRAFGTADRRRAYIANGLQICAFDGDGLTPIATLATRAPIYWAELNDDVFWTNGVDAGIIRAAHSVLPWRLPVPPVPNLAPTGGELPAGLYRVRVATQLEDGRTGPSSETVELALDGTAGLAITGIEPGARVYIAPANSTVFGLAGIAAGSTMIWNGSPDELGREEHGPFLSPLPQGVEVIAAWRGRLCAAQYLQGIDQTAVWLSQPFGPALFDLARDFVLVKGRVHMLLPQDAGLVIGTDTAVHAYDGTRLANLDTHGVKPGRGWDLDDNGRGIFWSARGTFCSALPFEYLTDRQISVAPGIRAAGAVIRRGGQRRFVVSLHQGGQPFNPH